MNKEQVFQLLFNQEEFFGSSTNFIKMKIVDSFVILGMPESVTNVSCNCPCCGHELDVKADGSAFCTKEGLFLAPEPSDSDLWNLRKDFDAKNHISVSDRTLIPAKLRMELVLAGGVIGI